MGRLRKMVAGFRTMMTPDPRAEQLGRLLQISVALEARVRRTVGSWSGSWTPNPELAGATRAPIASFPFGTDAANKVWQAAANLVSLYPEENEDEILRRAFMDSEVDSYELGPEDVQLIKMAVQWARNGPPPSVARSSGAPGGPFRQGGDGT